MSGKDFPIASSRRNWSRRMVFGVLGAGCLAGCVAGTSSPTTTFAEPQPTGEIRFRSDSGQGGASVSSASASTNAPFGGSVYGGPVFASLPNRTKVPGPNLVETRFTKPRGNSPAALLRAAGPLPAPFEFLLANDLRAARDNAGRVFYYAPRVVSGASCVLGLRADPSPNGGVVILRNCVPGGEAEALAPFTGSTQL